MLDASKDEENSDISDDEFDLDREISELEEELPMLKFVSKKRAGFPVLFFRRIIHIKNEEKKPAIPSRQL